MVSGFLSCFELKSALAELRSATGGFEAVFLSFLHSRVAGQEACGLEGGAELGVDAEKCACNAMTDGACLAGDAAAFDGADQIDLAQQIGSSQRLTDNHLQGVQAEVLIDIPAVDGDGAGAVGEQMDAGHRATGFWACCS